MANREIVEQFYRATQAGDGEGILASLHPRFEARVAPGLPSVAGAKFHGPKAALTGCWGPVAQDYRIAPFAERWIDAPGDIVIVTGHYRGEARATGHPVEAEFAHIWRVSEGKIIHLHQFTDTWQWRTALVPAA
ncbi:nuclear transport factor 2 family protein [Nocardia sp. NPDC051030]|uniref:nuclear transport factor 2 family protein n=1 Tax=Nocardia sp. NPDC051030 TaxID=3155162 RepID=UPI0034356229